MFVIGISSVINYTLPTASSIIVTCEMTRMCMKMHSYLREKIVYGMKNDSDFANYIPKWAADKGVKIEDLTKP